jgi:hypothetical protein
MGKQDRKLKRKKLKLRLLEGGKRPEPKAGKKLSPAEDLHAALLTFIGIYFHEQKQKPRDERINDQVLLIVLWRMVAKLALLLGVTEEQFIEGAEGVYQEQAQEPDKNGA